MIFEGRLERGVTDPQRRDHKGPFTHYMKFSAYTLQNYFVQNSRKSENIKYQRIKTIIRLSYLERR